MKLNCDLGESYGAWHMGADEHAMQHIDLANIACGFHGGDAVVMRDTVMLAKQHNVTIGAHPSYPDLQGFGRRSMQCSEDEIYCFMHYQIAALTGIAAAQGMTLRYVKPHGALYNDMMSNDIVRRAIMKSIAEYPLTLQLMLQATPDQAKHRAEALAFNVELLFEAFADRRYTDQGQLMSRRLPGAVLNHKQTLAQVKQMVETGTITSDNGQVLTLSIDTLCVHGDNVEAVKAIAEIKAMIKAAQ